MMTPDKTPPAYSKKQILADPISLYARLHPDNDKENDQLQSLWQRRTALKQQQKELQLQSKKVSREIGQAKRNNESIDRLKSTMQLLSGQISDGTKQLHKTDEAILDYFKDTSDITDDKTDAEQIPITVFNYGKRNYIETIKTDEISIRRLNKPSAAWNNYVEQHPAGCIHHRSEWLNLFYDSYRHPCFFFAAYDNKNNIVGILPLVRLTSRLFGDLLVSMPYFQRGGAIADHPLIEQRLISHANQQAENLDIEHIEYRDDIERSDMPVQSHKVNMVLALPQDSDDLWQNFSSKLRAQIKRPQRENPETFFGHEDLLNDFYAVYSRNMRDLGSPVHSKKFIANILKQFPKNSWLVVIKLKRKPVAAALLLANGDTMEIPLASTIRDVNHLSLNMLLYWEILQFAIKKRYRYFDFGRSTKGAGTYRFKQQWGAQPQPLYWHYWLSQGNDMPALNPDNPKFALLINLWKRLPVKVSQWIGPHIVKNIP